MKSKYNFKGLKKIGAASLLSAASLSFQSVGLGSLITNKFSYWVLEFLVQKFVNWALNNGLYLLNIAEIEIRVPMEKRAFDEAIKKALKYVEENDKISKEKLQELDEEVVAAFDRFSVFTKLSDRG